MKPWQPNQYLTFEKERTQPAVDLANRIELETPKRIVDLGCGPGNSTRVLQKKWPNAEIIGVDSSASMLEKARMLNQGIKFVQQDVTEGLEGLGQFDIVFSNAMLQWVPQQELLIERMYQLLNPGGVLAVQIPYTEVQPFYQGVTRVAQEEKWKKYFPQRPQLPSYHAYPYYYKLVRQLTDLFTLWQTDYIHVLESHEALLSWHTTTGLRPYLAKLHSKELQTEFLAACKREAVQAYPVQEDGCILFVFERIFFTAEKPLNA